MRIQAQRTLGKPQALGRVGAALPKLPDPLALLRGLRGARPRG